MSTLPLSTAVGRLPPTFERAMAAGEAVVPSKCPAADCADIELAAGGLGEGEAAVDDAEVHADGAGGGAVDFGHGDHEHDLLLAGDAEAD